MKLLNILKEIKVIPPSKHFTFNDDKAYRIVGGKYKVVGEDEDDYKLQNIQTKEIIFVGKHYAKTNNISEIKVNAPRPFTYDAYYYDEDDESTEGELYFNGELLDGDAVYSYGFSGEEKIYYIAFYINTPTYARLFNSLSPHIHDKIIGGSTKRTLAQITDYADDYEHGLIIRDLNKVNLKNLPPFINEIKVLSPNPLKFKVKQDYYNNILGGDLYLNDKLIANGALLNKINKTLEVVFWVENYEKIKDQLPTHIVVTSSVKAKHIIITNISGVNVVDKEGKLYEIKVIPPSPFRLELESPHFGNLYFNDQLLDSTALLSSNKDFIECFIPRELYKTIKDQLPKHDMDVTNYHDEEYYDVSIRDISKVKIIDKKDSLDEIKVLSPSPFRFEAENAYFGKLYFNNQLLDGLAMIQNKSYIEFIITKKLYKTIKDLLPKHDMLMNSKDYNAVSIRDLSKVNIVDEKGFLKEIKVLPPSSFRLEVKEKLDPDQVNDEGDYYEGSSYFNDILLDEYTTLKDKESIVLDIAPKIYHTIKDKLPPHDVEYEYDWGDSKGEFRIKIEYTKDLNIIYKQDLLNEIKVSIPGLIGTLQTYRSQINFDDDLKKTSELALQGAKLVLPIFERLVPKDKTPRKAIESAQTYLLNPTTENKRAITQVSSVSPGYPDAAKLVKNAIYMAVWAIANNDSLGDFPRDNKYAQSSITYALAAAQKDQPTQLDEIKVIPPPTLRFEINNERKSTVRNEFFGNLYLHSELLDDMAFLSLNKAMVIAMPKEVFDRVKDQLPPFEVLDMFGLDEMVEILFDDTKDIRIIDKQGLMNEIRINKPGKPFKFVVTKKNMGLQSGELYFKDKLIDNSAYFDKKWIIAYVDFDQENLQKDIEPYISMRLKRNQYKNQGKFFRHTRNSNGDIVKEFHIEGDQLENNVDIVDNIKEIKVLSPSPFRVEVYLHDEEYEEDYNAESYFNDMLLDDDTIVNTEDDVIIVDILSETYDTIKNLLPPHQVLANLLGKFGLNATLTRIKIKGLKNINIIYKDSIQEIKVLSPSPFRFEVTKKRPALMRGKLYFNDTILDDDSILYTGDNSIVAEIPSKIFKTIKDQLPSHEMSGNPNHLQWESYIVEITDISNIKIIDNIKEIKVLSPSPFRFEITDKSPSYTRGKSYFNDILLDDEAVLGGDAIFIDINPETYNTIKDQLPSHRLIEYLFNKKARIVITNLKDINIIDNIKEIKVMPPSPFRFEVTRMGDKLREGKLYFNDTLLDDDALFFEDQGFIAVHISPKIYDVIKDILPPYDIMSTYLKPEGRVRVITINDLSNIRIVNNLNEIRVNTPGLLGTLETYQRQMSSTEDKEIRKQLALKCAELVLSIFEKKFPNDKRPHKAIKAAKNYMLDPTDKNRLAVEKAEEKSEDASYIPGIDSDAYSAVAIAASWAAKTCIGFDYAAIPAADYAIRAAELDAGIPINEIKVNSPGLVSTLENYQRQVLSSDDVDVKKQLIIKGAELVLPIFEKKYPNDNRPRKALETIKAYLLNPTEENKEIARDASNSTAYSWESDIYNKIWYAAFAAIYANEFILDWDDWEDDDTYAKSSIANAIRAAKLDADIPIDEIKINKPNSTLRFEINPNSPMSSAHIGGSLYLGNKLLDSKVIWYEYRNVMHVTLPLETYYSIKDQLPSYEEVYEYESSYHKGMRVIDLYINDLSDVEFVGSKSSLDEIKVVAPGIISTLENYRSKIKSTQDANVKKELVLRCADLILPIFEKHYPNDDRPRNAIEAAKAYLLDPTEENEETLRYEKSGASDANVAAYHNGYNDNHSAVVASAAISLATSAVYNHVQVAESAANSAIKAAKIDAGLSINEIKINAPKPFVFEIYEYDDQERSYAGKLFFNGQLLAEIAIYTYDFPGFDGRKQYYIAFYITTEKYKELFNQLIPYIYIRNNRNTPEFLDSFSDGYRHFVSIRNLDSVEIVDKQGLLTEIKVISPGLIGTLEHYASQINSSNDVDVKKQLALKCAELVLPIYEKKFPNDSRPRKAIEAVKVYLANPTKENDSIVVDNSDEVDNAKHEADKLGTRLYSPYEAAAHAITSVKYAIDNIIYDVYCVDCAKIAGNTAAKAALLDAGQSIEEIKVVPPVGPGKLKVEGPYMHWGDFAGYVRSQHNPELPIKDKFVDILTDYVRIYFSINDGADFESNFKMFESYLNRRSIKFTLIDSTNRYGEKYYLVKIPKSQIEFVNRQGLIGEIKVNIPGWKKFTLTKSTPFGDYNTISVTLKHPELKLWYFGYWARANDYITWPYDPEINEENGFKTTLTDLLNKYNLPYKEVNGDNPYIKIPLSLIDMEETMNEIKVVPPQRRINPDEYEVIYQLLNGDRKPTYLNDDLWSIDFNLMSREYFTNPNPIFVGPERYEEIAEYLDKNNMLLALRALPVIELDNPNVHYRDNAAKYPKQQYYILKHDNKFYFVDTQGFDYPRYVTYLKNFPL